MELTIVELKITQLQNKLFELPTGYTLEVSSNFGF